MNSTLSKGFWIAVLFLVLGIGAAFFVTLIRGVVEDSDNNRPAIPAPPAITSTMNTTNLA